MAGLPFQKPDLSGFQMIDYRALMTSLKEGGGPESVRVISRRKCILQMNKGGG